jgi:hypothetical protein
MTLDQFKEVRRLLQESGKGDPPGRIHHSCFGDDGDLMVYDIWESPEASQAFGELLMPITCTPLISPSRTARPWSGGRPSSRRPRISRRKRAFQVYADPAGHPFCIGWGQPSPERLRQHLSQRHDN